MKRHSTILCILVILILCLNADFVDSTTNFITQLSNSIFNQSIDYTGNMENKSSVSDEDNKGVENTDTWQEHYEAGMTYMAEEKYLDAHIEFMYAKDLAPKRAELWYLYGKSGLLDNPSDSYPLSAFKTACELDPSLTEAWIGQVDVLVVQEDFTGALSVLESALEKAADKSAIELKLQEVIGPKQKPIELGTANGFYSRYALVSGKILEPGYIERYPGVVFAYDGNVQIGCRPKDKDYISFLCDAKGVMNDEFKTVVFNLIKTMNGSLTNEDCEQIWAEITDSKDGLGGFSIYENIFIDLRNSRKGQLSYVSLSYSVRK